MVQPGHHHLVTGHPPAPVLPLGQVPGEVVGDLGGAAAVDHP
ncbi:hypothetical protein [Nocardiopsis listeri]|nr:hypothetical protein [Nocardiopsis listeri]